MTFPMMPEFYYRLIIVFFLIGAMISTVEFLSILPSFGHAGIYSWRVLEAEQRARFGLRLPRFMWKVLGSRAVVVGLLLARIVSLICLPFLPLQSLAFASCAGVLVASTLLFTLRRYIGDDGSDQMAGIVAVTLFLCAGLGRGEWILKAGLWFLTFQCCLSYFAAGVAKAVSGEWRNGSATFMIFNTEAYGIPWIATLLKQRRELQIVLAWSVIGMECLFPLALLAPLPMAVCFLVWGATFHLLCAAIMGLNTFFWAFVATYPAVIFTWQMLH